MPRKVIDIDYQMQVQPNRKGDPKLTAMTDIDKAEDTRHW